MTCKQAYYEKQNEKLFIYKMPKKRTFDLITRMLTKISKIVKTFIFIN